MRKAFCIGAVFAVISAMPATAAELKPATVSAFDRYIHAVEERMGADIRGNVFFVMDRLPEARRQVVDNQLREGEVHVEELHAEEDHQPVRVPFALINHWARVIFIPHATLAQVLSVLHDYDHQDVIYQPRIRRSKLISKNGNQSIVRFQLYNKSLVTVFLNADFEVTDTDFGTARHQIAMRSTRIAEVVNPDRPNEHEMAPGNDHGYLWRFNTYWRIAEQDGGVCLQNESIALSRSIPAPFAWLIRPLTDGIPRDILIHLLTATRDATRNAVSASHIP